MQPTGVGCCVLRREPIPPEKRCVLTCCYAIYNQDSLFQCGTPTITKCANCRHPIGAKGTGILMEQNVREQMMEAEPPPPPPPKAPVASRAPESAAAVGTRVEEALRESECDEMKVADKVEQIVSSVAPLYAKKGGMRVLLALKYHEVGPEGPKELVRMLSKIEGVDSVATVTDKTGVAAFQSPDKVNRLMILNIGLSHHTTLLEGLDLQCTQLTIAHDCQEREGKLVQLIGRSLRVSASADERLPKFFYSLTTK